MSGVIGRTAVTVATPVRAGKARRPGRAREVGVVRATS